MSIKQKAFDLIHSLDETDLLQDIENNTQRSEYSGECWNTWNNIETALMCCASAAEWCVSDEEAERAIALLTEGGPEDCYGRSLLFALAVLGYQAVPAMGAEVLWSDTTYIRDESPSIGFDSPDGELTDIRIYLYGDIMEGKTDLTEIAVLDNSAELRVFQADQLPEAMAFAANLAAQK